MYIFIFISYLSSITYFVGKIKSQRAQQVLCDDLAARVVPRRNRLLVNMLSSAAPLCRAPPAPPARRAPPAGQLLQARLACSRFCSVSGADGWMSDEGEWRMVCRRGMTCSWDESDSSSKAASAC